MTQPPTFVRALPSLHGPMSRGVWRRNPVALNTGREARRDGVIRVIIQVVACIFCDILSGVASAEFVARRDAASAFLPLPSDRLASLHTLVVPNRHVDDVMGGTDSDLTATMSLCREIANAMVQVIGADGVNLLNASGPHSEQSVFHLHIHVVPRWRGDGLSTWPVGRSRRELSAGALDTLTEFLAG
jgi:histidine triad (HIT) family protein